MNDVFDCIEPAAWRVETLESQWYVCEAHHLEVFSACFRAGHVPTSHRTEGTSRLCGADRAATEGLR
ncbi:hypothetical protein [Salininema proteolyticum]|uniref:Uncharacterized protein n=1 Tax=Salininema proteolyticum TaxID=1607685 RepID=A0ABV8TWN5_9ACTN